MGNLYSLEYLNLIENRLSALPLEMVNLYSLKNLYLDNNQQTHGMLGVRFYAFLLTALRIARQWEGIIMHAMP